MKISKKIKTLLKWTLIVVASYFILDSIYFGNGTFNTKTGMSSFYWSGLDDLQNSKKPYGFLINEPYPTFLNGEDGPYVFGKTAFYVNNQEELVKQSIDSSQQIIVKTGLKEMPVFKVNLRENYTIENDHYNISDRLIAISDIEGNLTGFYSFLLSNKVIDNNGNWIFGDGSLVLNGDFMDRGSQVTQLLWFIYHLENQANTNGGKVHFILGNHEMMNLYGNASDNDFKYIEVAKRISGKSNWSDAIQYLYSQNSELGKWLRSKNIVEKIGNIIFVHGGLNKYHIQQKYSIAELNSTARKYIGIYPEKLKNLSDRERLIVANSLNSPYWDRKLNYNWKIKLAYAMKGKFINATSQQELNDILQFYDAEKIIIGHSNISDITAKYNNKVILLDVPHGEEIHSGHTKGLLIENNKFYKVDDTGNKSLLFKNR